MESIRKYRGLLLAFAIVVGFALLVKLRSNAVSSTASAPTTGLTAPASAGQDSVSVVAPAATVPGVAASAPASTAAAPFGKWLRGLPGRMPQLALPTLAPAAAPGRGSAAAVAAPLSASSQTATDAANVQAESGDPFGAFLQELGISGLPMSLN